MMDRKLSSLLESEILEDLIAILVEYTNYHPTVIAEFFDTETENIVLAQELELFESKQSTPTPDQRLAEIMQVQREALLHEEIFTDHANNMSYSTLMDAMHGCNTIDHGHAYLILIVKRLTFYKEPHVLIGYLYQYRNLVDIVPSQTYCYEYYTDTHGFLKCRSSDRVICKQCLSHRIHQCGSISCTSEHPGMSDHRCKEGIFNE